MASCHSRSSPEIAAANVLGGKKLSARFVECVAVTPGTSDRLVTARFGILELSGSGELTAISASPPPGATPRFPALPTLLAHPPMPGTGEKAKIPQLSGWPSYLNGIVPSAFGPTSMG